MRHGRIIGGFGAGMIFLLCLPSLLSQTVEAKVTYSLVHSRIDVTEPVVLKLEFANLTDESLELNLGWDSEDRIYFTRQGPSGRMEIHQPPPTTFDQISRFGEVDIAPKGTRTQEIVLSQWAPFDTPGDYTIEIHIRGLLGLKAPDSLQVQTEAVSLTVESNAGSLVQQHCAEEWKHLKDAHDGGEAMEAALFLGNVTSPLAVPFMSAALDTEHATAIGGILISGLERIGNKSAVQVLAKALSGKNSQNAQAAHEALSRVVLQSPVPEVAREARVALDTPEEISKP
jgi:hypothetical protein